MTPIYLAPLQSYTNVFYRKAYNEVYGGITKYFTPFFEEGKGSLTTPHLLPELDQELNKGSFLVPQVATNNARFLIDFANESLRLGYNEININMGCPFPMLVKRHKGGGMISDPMLVSQILDQFFKAELPIKLSIKTRAGMACVEEGVGLMKVLNNYDLEEVIVHPRLVTQKYNGEPDWYAFDRLVKDVKHRVVANGDITRISQIKDLTENYPCIRAVMVGRGILANPSMCQEQTIKDEEFNKHKQFHDTFIGYLMAHSIDWNQGFNQLMNFWYYPLNKSVEGKRLWRKLRKNNTRDLYASWLDEVWTFLYN